MFHSPSPKRIHLPNKRPNNSTYVTSITHRVSKIKGKTDHQTHLGVAIYILILTI